MPALVLVADRDQFMSPADELIRRLQPTRVVHFPELDHDAVVRDPIVVREAVGFLTM